MRTRCCALLGALIAVLCLLPSARADDAPTSLAHYLPDDTLAHLVVSPGLKAALRKTAPGRILDEPEVKLLVDEIVANTARDFSAFERAIGFRVRDLLNLFDDGEVSLTLTGISTNTNPVADRLLLAARGAQAAQAWDKLLALALAEAKAEYPRLKVSRYSLKQCEVRSIRVGPVTLSLATYKGWWLASTDATALATLVAQLERGPREDSLAARSLYRDMKARATRGRPGAFLYFDFAGLREEVLIGPLKSQRGLVAKLGLDKLRAIAAASVCTDKGFVERVVIDAPGATTGVYSLLASLPKSDRSALKLAPEKTVFCIAGALDPLDTATAWRQFIGSLDAKQAEQLDAGVRAFERSAGIALPDLIGKVGPRFCLYLTMPDHEGLMPDLCLVVETRDPKGLAATLDRLVARATRAGDEAPALDIREVPWVGGRSYRYVNLSRLGEQQVVAPAWAIQGNWLVIGHTPNNFKNAWTRVAALEAGTARSLTDTPRWERFASQIDGRWGSLAYLDAGRLLVASYETLAPFVQAVVPKGDVPFEPALLPRAHVLARHLHGVGLAAQRDGRGLTLELASPIGLVPFVVFGGVSDALQKRAKARGYVEGQPGQPTVKTPRSPLVSFAFQQTDLAQALDALARLSGAEIRFSRELCRAIPVENAQADGVALDRALSLLVPADRMSYRVRPLPGGKLQVVIYPRSGAQGADGGRDKR